MIASSNILSSAVLRVAPSSIFSSFVSRVAPSSMFISLASAVTWVPAMYRTVVLVLSVLNVPLTSSVYWGLVVPIPTLLLISS